MNLTLNEFRNREGAYHGSGRYTYEAAPDVGGQVGMFTAMDVATGRTLWVHRQRPASAVPCSPRAAGWCS